jgi:hypothetical protein
MDLPCFYSYHGLCERVYGMQHFLGKEDQLKGKENGSHFFSEDNGCSLIINY